MPIALYLYILIQLIIVAYIDFRTKKIANVWSILNLIVLLPLLYFYPNLFPLRLLILVYPLSFLFVGFGLFAMKVMGAGDVKFLTTFFFLVPVIYQESVFKNLLYITILSGTISLIVNYSRNFKDVTNRLRIGDFTVLRERFGIKFPFAPIILVSWVMFGWNFKKLLF